MFQSYVTQHRCAGGLKKDDLQVGSDTIDSLKGSLTCPSKNQQGNSMFYCIFDRTTNISIKQIIIIENPYRQQGSTATSGCWVLKCFTQMSVAISNILEISSATHNSRLCYAHASGSKLRFNVKGL